MNEVTKGAKNAIYQRNQDLIGASIDDELVMMSVEKGQYYGLSGIGPRVWELMDEPLTLDQLIERIVEEFEVERDVCRADMIQFLEQIEKLGLVERV